MILPTPSGQHVLRAFSFHIDPHASFDRGESRRKWNRIGLAFNLGMFASLLRLFAPKPEPTPKQPASALKRIAPYRPPARFLQSPHEFLDARQTQHRGHAISASLGSDGRWIASFGGPGGRPLNIAGNIQAVGVTQPYRAQCLALAEAQLRIEASGIS